MWDLRAKRCLYTIPGHRSLVSSVKYERDNGWYIASGGYDCLVKVGGAGGLLQGVVLGCGEGELRVLLGLRLVLHGCWVLVDIL